MLCDVIKKEWNGIVYTIIMDETAYKKGRSLILIFRERERIHVVISKIMAETLLFLVALPLMAFQSIEMIGALIEFAAEMTQYFKSK